MLIRFLVLFAISLLFGQNEDSFTTTEHMIELNGRALTYHATAGFCPIFSGKDKDADIFFISYTKPNDENRPITFSFPGGPGGAGSSMAILSFGPRRLLTSEEGGSIHAPFEMIDNPETLLDKTDLVFVDPIECGYSQIADDVNPKYYFSVEGDIESLGKFIYNYLNYFSRWNSPIYLEGGSYGTLRCCGLAEHLLQYGIAVKGIILNGCAFDYSTIISQRDKPFADWLLIPTCAATAWYHGRLWPEKPLEEVLDYARRFTYESFAPYMLQPSRFSPIEKSELEKQLAKLIGLPLETVKKYNGRINEEIYSREFFQPERKTLGRLDSRFSGDVAEIHIEGYHDPSYLDSIFGILPALTHYLQRELNVYIPNMTYVSYSHDAMDQWDFRTKDTFGEPGLLNRLRWSLILNPKMQVFIASGYYDCRTPFAATEYCFDHLDLPPSYRKNLHFKYYEAGHGHIFDYPSLKKWKKDLSTFYD